MTPEKRREVIARARVVADGIVRYRAMRPTVEAQLTASWPASGGLHGIAFMSAVRRDTEIRSGFPYSEEFQRFAEADWGEFAELIAILTDREESTEDEQT